MKIKIVVAVLISVLLHIGFAADSTIVLQNGLNGYMGCSDTYIRLGGYQLPHYTEGTILVGEYYCTT